MKTGLTFLLLFYFIFSFSQKKIIENFEIEIDKAKEPSSFSNALLRSVKFDEAKLKFIMVKCKIKSLDKDFAEISAFSLLDTVNKVRYRVGDYLGYASIVGFPEVNPYRKSESNDKKYTYNSPKYDSNEIDQFDKFNFEGYKNFEIPIEFGSEKKPDQSVIYFGKTAYKNFKAEMFFITLREMKDAVFELYYKNNKISSFQIE